MKKLIVANWKMHPRSANEAKRLYAQIAAKAWRFKNAEAVIASPYPFIGILRRKSAVAMGAQDVFWDSEGSYTGEVSSAMLKDFGVKYVILGHSERRKYLYETDELINKKVKHAVKVGLKPIICIGESKRDADGAFYAFLRKQIERAVAGVKKDDIRNVVVAYEPIWSISPGRPAKPRDAYEASLFIRKTLARTYGVPHAKSMRILYGGSVNGANAAEYLKSREIGGFLVGRESLKAKSFLSILACTNANQ